ncbi:MAG TPA: dienelactone hydrolase family protein, partial [Xanthobacteraceae bacterium]|nr:dienelactone hydrolase family protein [Xanthobacteraceae bacterium]
SYTYEGANHAFFDNTTARYDAKAAALAWERSKAFFSEHLKS